MKTQIDFYVLSEISKDHEVKVFISLALSLFDKGNKGSISLLNADRSCVPETFSALVSSGKG